MHKWLKRLGIGLGVLIVLLVRFQLTSSVRFVLPGTLGDTLIAPMPDS